jgi:hypothetical protein
MQDDIKIILEGSEDNYIGLIKEMTDDRLLSSW